ncbi:MAG: transposase IS200-family protein [Acidobacteriales bacterium]|nr:transposase IS200-family protein [Terriglobales bacterium]
MSTGVFTNVHESVGRNYLAQDVSPGSGVIDCRVPKGRHPHVTHISQPAHAHYFSTKDRARLIPGALQDRLWQYMAQTAENIGIKVLAIGGVEDHAHLGVILPAKMGVSEAAQKIKANSSRWMNANHVKGFSWQEGFAGFGISVSHSPALVKYIRSQREHHRKDSFEEELEKDLEQTRNEFERFAGTEIVSSLKGLDRSFYVFPALTCWAK